MDGELTARDDASETEINELRARLKAQGDELDALRAQLVPSSGPTRRDVLKAGGLVAGGIAALTAGIAGVRSEPVAAVEGHNVRERGGLYIYLTLKGQKHGTINGSVTQKGRENSIQVSYLQQKKVSPRDPSSGLSTGKILHEPLVFRKTVDKSSPILQDVMSNNENLTEVHFKFWKPNTLTGAETQWFAIDLVNANIASLDLYHPDTLDSGAGSASAPDQEELSLTYQKIAWTYVDGGITSQDDLNNTA
jgi:type VI secretion system secreted protein Hcp